MVLIPLDAEALDDLRDALSFYLDGECYAFAAALQRLTGWPIVALRTSEHDFRHAAVRDPNGRLWDVRGRVSDEDFGEPFGAHLPLDVREVTLTNLRTVRPVFDDSIDSAANYAEIALPDLPCLPNSRRERMKRFMAELEELSRRHGFWIRPKAPAQHLWPLLAPGEGDEHYEVRPTHDGNGYGFDRTLG